MNSLQIELDKINQQLELLTYRKTQLDSIMGEYSDVINRVKNLVLSMEDANVEPSNLLMEIETLIHCPEPEPEPDSNHEKINSYIIPFDPVLHGEPEPTPEPVAKPFTFDISLYPKTNSLGLPVSTPETDDDNDCDTDGLDDEDYGFDDDSDDDSDDEIEESEPSPEQRGNSLLFHPNIYWDNGSSVRVFIPKKRRYKGELEAIVGDCIEQGLVEKYEINECGDNLIIGLSPVTDEMAVNAIIDNFYPKHFDGEVAPQPTPEPVKLMAMIATVPNTKAPSKIQLNDRAYRRDDTLLIGFSNKQLMAQWYRWAKDSWGDRIHIDDTESLDGFKYCLSILWYGKNTDWERLKALDYSLKPNEQPSTKTDDFTYQSANSKTWQIFRDGVLLGLAKDCDGHWESPQFKDEQFESRETVAVKLWELINNF